MNKNILTFSILALFSLASFADLKEEYLIQQRGDIAKIPGCNPLANREIAKGLCREVIFSDEIENIQEVQIDDLRKVTALCSAPAWAATIFVKMKSGSIEARPAMFSPDGCEE